MQSQTSVVVTLLCLFVGHSSAVVPCANLLPSGDSVKDKLDALLCQQLQEEAAQDGSLSLDDRNGLDSVPLLNSLADSEDDDELLNTRSIRSDSHARYGRDPEHKFMRFGREPEHKFMRFGRLPEHKFLRFGREPEHKFMRFGRYYNPDQSLFREQRDPQHKFMRFGRSVDLSSYGPLSEGAMIMRSSRQPEHKFLRFGRNSQTPENQLDNTLEAESASHSSTSKQE